MRVFKNTLLMFSLILLTWPASTLAIEKDINIKGKKISLDFKDVGLKDILKAFSMQSGMNFIASDKIEDKKITLYMESVPVSSALDTILKANNLTYEQPSGTNIIMIKEMRVPEVETLTQIYKLNYANAEGVKTLFDAMSKVKKIEEVSSAGSKVSKSFSQGVLSEYGKIAADTRTNSLIVTDIPARFPIIEEAIAKLDEPTPQVMIEAEILEVSTDYMEQIGIDFGTNGFAKITGAVKNTELLFRDLAGTPSTDNAAYGTISTSSFTAILDMLKSDTKTKVLARPRILTLNNETAEIKITAETAVSEITESFSDESRTETSAERIETGVSLIVTPVINNDGYVTIKVEPKVTEPKDSKFFKGTYVDPHTRSAKTTIRVRDGDTLVMGGLIKLDETITVKKIPFLGDIPILGRVFRHNYTLTEDRELIIFITPHIVRDSHYNVSQAFQVEREFSVEESAVNKEQAIEESLEGLN
ncbi:MAG: secretin N-terminal domain-containing protein [Candidatus Kaelpia imicola]|nr:secretin N-terminal domain-containing protein [Candidatus Kaelpia imicola]